MLWYLIPTIILILSLGVIALIIFRHAKTLRTLDLEAMKTHQQKEVKIKIIEERIKRQYEELKNKIRVKLKPYGEGIYAKIKDFLEKLKTKKPKEIPEEILRRKITMILGEAKALFDQNKLNEAEKKYIEAIALDKDNLEAYQGLSKVYLALKDYPHAFETLNFLKKINPADDSLWLDLGNVCQQMSNSPEAIVCYKKAVELAPNNPKNLDLLLETAILAKEKYLAMRTFDKLKEVNPENQKLADYEEQIKTL